jgi:DNA-binding transcriptional regulator YiaG
MAETEQQQVSLAIRLRSRRYRLMLSQADAAEALGVSLRIYQAWEHGTVTEPHPRNRKSIDAWLNGGDPT